MPICSSRRSIVNINGPEQVKKPCSNKRLRTNRPRNFSCVNDRTDTLKYVEGLRKTMTCLLRKLLISAISSPCSSATKKCWITNLVRILHSTIEQCYYRQEPNIFKQYCTVPVWKCRRPTKSEWTKFWQLKSSHAHGHNGPGHHSFSKRKAES